MRININLSPVGLVEFIVFLFSVLMIVSMVYCLHFGVNLADEKSFVSIPYRFTLGDRPFVDEYNILQFASFFTLPLIKIYLYLKGSAEGILLFTRYLYFISSVLIATLVFFSFKKITTRYFSVLLALPCIVFVPFNTHSLSYNTLGMFFLTAGFFLGFQAAMEYRKNPSRKIYLSISFCDLYVFFAGLCHVSALICYPPLSLIPVLYICCLAYFLPMLRTVFFYMTGTAIGAIWFLMMIAHVDYTQLMIDYSYVTAAARRGNGLEKLIKVISDYFQFFLPHKYMLVSVFIITCLLLRTYLVLFSLLVLFPIIGFITRPDELQHIIQFFPEHLMAFPQKRILLFLFTLSFFVSKKYKIIFGAIALVLISIYMAPINEIGNKLSEFLQINNQFWMAFPHKKIFISTLAFLYFLNIKYNLYKITLPIICAVFLVIIFFRANVMDPFNLTGAFAFGQAFDGSMIFVSSINFITPILFLLARNQSPIISSKLFFLVWLPSFVAGLITSWSTGGSALTASSIGAFPGALVGIFYLTMISSAVVRTSSNKFVANLQLKLQTTSLIVPIVFIEILQCYNIGYTFSLSASKFDYKMTEGPLKGIYTTRDVGIFYTELAQDIKLIYKLNKRILFFNDFPEGYLFSTMRPATNTVYIFQNNSLKYITLAYFEKQHVWPDFIFKMSSIPCSPCGNLFTCNVYDNFCLESYSKDPIVSLIDQKYKLKLHRSKYDIYERI